jgi:phospholipase D-like protein
MIDVEGFVAVAVLLFWIWALLDCIATDSAMIRNLPKVVWVVIVLLLPLIGSFAWLLLGRPERASWRPGSADYSAPRRPIALEDSPRYSATPSVTDRRSAELDAELDRWLDQRELDRRELEQRERELDE